MDNKIKKIINGLEAGEQTAGAGHALILYISGLEDRIIRLERSNDRLNARLQRICPHPKDKLEMSEMGSMRFVGGEVVDSQVSVLVCTQCGKAFSVEESNDIANGNPKS